jgi:hypothetical protein
MLASAMVEGVATQWDCALARGVAALQHPAVHRMHACASALSSLHACMHAAHVPAACGGAARGQVLRCGRARRTRLVPHGGRGRAPCACRALRAVECSLWQRGLDPLSVRHANPRGGGRRPRAGRSTVLRRSGPQAALVALAHPLRILCPAQHRRGALGAARQPYRALCRLLRLWLGLLPPCAGAPAAHAGQRVRVHHRARRCACMPDMRGSRAATQRAQRPPPNACAPLPRAQSPRSHVPGDA